MEELLKKILADPKVAEQFAAAEKTDDEKAKIAAFVKAANDNGYNVTPAEVDAAIKAAEEKRIASEEEAKKAISQLSMDELDRVAGGGKHINCADTFLAYENCWFSDGCDHIINGYDNYLCKSEYMDCGANYRYLLGD